MKIRFAIVLLFIASLAWSQQDSMSQLMIIVNGAKTDSGNIMVAVSESEKNFMTPGVAYKAASLNINEGMAEWTIDSLPFGFYAIKVFHDVNDNDKLDTKMFGVPSEPYGFSNNPKTKMGPASWKDAMFEIREPEKKVIIELK